MKTMIKKSGKKVILKNKDTSNTRVARTRIGVEVRLSMYKIEPKF